jgi:hypothetical protein
MYWLKPPGLITMDMPLLNKYVDLINIKTVSLSEENDLLMTTMCQFIKNNYMARKDVSGTSYLPSKSNIIEYLTSSNHASYITLYQQPKILFDKNVPETCIDEVLAVITARPLYIRINKGKNKTMFPLYYVDNLCVHPGHRKKNIASTMIQTHYYNLRRQNKNIHTCLFKREGTLNAIVPLVVFNTYGVTINSMTNANATNAIGTNATNAIGPNDTNDTNAIGPSLKLIEIGITQLPLLVDFIKENTIKHFTCVILPDVTNLMNLIKTNNLVIYAFLKEGVIIACYIFRLTEFIYAGQKTADCIMMLSAKINTDIFSIGFAMACSTLQKKHKVELVLIEDTAHAHIITAKLLAIDYKFAFISPTAFFLYNYVTYSIKKLDFLIIY